MQTRSFPFQAMACPCEILLCSAQAEAGRSAAERAIAEVKRVEHKYSRYRPDSIISQINRAAGSGRAVSCDDETVWLFGYADTLFDNSDGLFDITSGVLRRVWNFREPRLPEAGELAAVVDLIGWKAVDRKGRQISLPRAGMEVDFGGFGKEYAADRAAATLREHGIEFGYVNLGGDIRVIGPQPDGQPWVIGVQDPAGGEKIVASIPLYGGALATSGDYQKFFEIDGKRYSHILSPLTGLPVSHWHSVSVLAPLALAAGSCTTIAMLKEEQGIDFLNNTGFVYLAIDGSGDIYKRDSPENKA